MAPFTAAQAWLCWTTTLGSGAGVIPGYFGKWMPGECPSPYFFLQGIPRTCGFIRLPSRVCPFT